MQSRALHALDSTSAPNFMNESRPRSLGSGGAGPANMFGEFLGVDGTLRLVGNLASCARRWASATAATNVVSRCWVRYASTAGTCAMTLPLSSAALAASTPFVLVHSSIAIRRSDNPFSVVALHG